MFDDNGKVALCTKTVNDPLKCEPVYIKEEIDDYDIEGNAQTMGVENESDVDVKTLDYSMNNQPECVLETAENNQNNNKISELLLSRINKEADTLKEKVKIPQSNLKSIKKRPYIKKKNKSKKCSSLPESQHSDVSEHNQCDASITSDKPYSCNECSYRCTRPSNLRNHERTHTGEKPYSCSLCTYICSTTSNLNTHIKNKHSSEKPFSCEDCDYCAKSKNALLRHKKLHFNVKDFACELCPYKSIQYSKLQNHKKMVHTGERPYACDQCPYRSSNSTNLKSHIRTHISVRKYSCNDCAYTCHTKLLLSNHMCTHTGEKPFQCNVCNFKYITLSSLKRHQRKRHNMINDSL